MNLTQDEIKSIRFDIAFEKSLILDINKDLLNIDKSHFRECDLKNIKQMAERKIKRLESQLNNR